MPMAQKAYHRGCTAASANAAPRISSLEKNPANGGIPAIASVAIHMSAAVHGM